MNVLTIAPIARASFRVGYSNDVNSILVVSEDNLEREILHAARTVPSVNVKIPLGIGLDVCERNVYRNAELASGGGATFRVPIR